MPNGDELVKEFEEAAKEFESPFARVQEFFPGYRSVLTKLARESYWTQKRLMEYTGEYEKYLALETQYKSDPFQAKVLGAIQPWEYWRYFKFVQAGRQVPEELREEFDIATATYARASWTFNFTQALPYMLADPESGVATFDDALAKMPNLYMTDVDRKYAEVMFNKLAFLIPPSAEEPVVKTPEELLAFLQEGVGAKLELAGVHKLSVDELIKSFREPLPELPKGMTGEDVRSLMSDLAFSDEEIEDLDSIRNASESLAAAWAEESAQIELMRTGILEAEIPELSPGQWTKLLLTQPALAALELLEDYFEALPRPLAAIAVTNVFAQETAWAKEMRQIAEEYKFLGEGSWTAYSKAYTESEANWALKLVVEMIFDPTTYIGFGIATKITKPIPYVGKFVGGVERGWLELWDIPFKGIRGGLRAIPRTPGQAAFSKARAFFQDARAYFERAVGKPLMRGVTPDDVSRLGKEAIDFAMENPQLAAKTIHGRVGMHLLEHDFIDAARISGWLKRLGVVGEEVTQQTVHNINDSWFRLFRKINTLDEVSNEMIGLLGVKHTKPVTKKMANILSSELDNVVSSAMARLEAPTAKAALDNVFSELRLVTERQLRSPQYKFARNVGRVTSWSRMVERLVRSNLAYWVDRKVTAPMANQYLLFAGYGPMNIIESGMRSFLGGGEVLYPKSMSPVDELVKVGQGLTNVPYEFLEAQARLEMAIIVPSTGESLYRGGIIPYITKVGKRGFTIRIGTKNFNIKSMQNAMIDLPAEIGTRQRAWYLVGKYKQNLVDVAPVETKAIATIVDDASERLAGLTTLSRKEARDLTTQIYNASLVSPESVRALNVPIKQLEAQKALYSINKTLDRMTEVQSIFKESIRQEVNTGRIWTNIDGFMDRVKVSAKDFNITELEAQTRVMKNLVKDFTDNPPRDAFEFMRQLKEISDLTSGIGGRISDVRVTARARAAQLSAAEREAFHSGSWTEIQRFMDEVETSLGQIIDGIETYAGKVELTSVQKQQALSLLANQRIKLNTLLNTRASERTIITDWFAKKPKRFKNRQEATTWWNNLEAARSEPWDRYWSIQETLLEQEYMMREGLTSSVQDILHTPPVEVIDRLTPSHVAALWGGTGDDLSKSLIKAETMTLIGRREFIAQTRAKAARMAKRLGKNTADDVGFTRESVGGVYDQLLSQQGLDPRLAEPLTPMMEQFEEIRHELHHTLSTKKIPDADYEAISGFIGKVSDDLSQLDIYKPAIVEAAPAVELRALHTHPARVKGFRLSTKEEVNDYLSRLKNLASKEAPKEVPKMSEAIRAFREGDLGAAGVAADTTLSKVHKLYRTHHPEFELVRAPPVARVPEIIEARTAEEAGGHAFALKQRGYTGFGRYRTIDDAMAAAGGVGKGIDDIVLVESRGAYDLFYRGAAPKLTLMPASPAEPNTLIITYKGQRLVGDVTTAIQGDALIVGQLSSEVEGMVNKEFLQALDDALTAYAKGKGLRRIWVDAFERHQIMYRAAGYELTADLKYMEKAVVPPPEVPPKLPTAGERWMNLKDDAMLKARESYMLDFTDYSEHNMMDAAMRMIYPFWTYEWQRYMWLPRAFLRTPGLATGVGRYVNYSDSGYIPIPGTDIQFNPLRGTIFMGGFRRLYMRDFPEYYDAFPGMEVIDYFQRMGFYPGFHIMLPIIGFGALQGKPEWGELAPAWLKTGFDSLLAVAPDSAAKVLSEQLFPDRFRSYLTILTLIEEGHDGVAIWDKIEKGIATEEEIKLWGKAVKRASGLKGILFEQTGLFRLRPPEFTQFIESSKRLREELLGVSAEVQDIINRRYPVTGMRVTDYYHLDPLQQRILYEIEQYDRWAGVVSPLMPSTWQEEDRRIREYWEAVENISNKARETGFVDIEGNVELPPIVELNRLLVAGDISPEQWISMRGEVLSRAAAATTELKQTVYPDVPVTLEEREARYAERGIPAPTYHPGQELLWLYYEQRPLWRWNWDAERYEWDFNTYYAAIDAILVALPEPYKQTFLDSVMFNWTPMEQLYWTINREFLRPYRLARELIMTNLTPQERAIVKRYEVAKGAEREELMAVIHEKSGNKLISYFSSTLRDIHETMRRLDPELDAWLAFWGVVDRILTTEAQEVYDGLRTKYLTQNMIE